MSEELSPRQVYGDIIDLPHHQSPTRPHMSLHDRAAQFAPFAALTGYGDAVAETARFTDNMVTLDESAIDELEWKLREAVMMDKDITITYFVPDEKKDGGSYVSVSGRIHKIEHGMIVMDSGVRIPFERIREL